MRKNWLHLDFKGAIPAIGKMLESLAFWKDCGYNGIVFEYDDRIPWRTWSGTWRGSYYNKTELKDLLSACKELDLEVVPLIQVLGHLEWLLKHEQYHDWRENEFGREICPLHPETSKRLKNWIDEVIELHPNSRFIHLGADETFNLGTCERCREHDKMRIYLEHVSAICAYTISKKMQPLIWADMFWREKCIDLAEKLPDETILVDWQYAGKPPYDSTENLMRCGHEVMGASGIMVGWWEQAYLIQGEPQSRLENIIGWNRYADESQIGMIHTTWTRGSSLWNIRGSWNGSLPAFIAGGSPERWSKHSWFGFMQRLTRIMERNIPSELEEAAAETLALPVENALENESRRWWNLALRYQALQKQLLLNQKNRLCLNKVAGFVGQNEAMYRRECVEPFEQLLLKLEQWECEARQYWNDNELSDSDEFFATHSNVMREEINIYRSNK